MLLSFGNCTHTDRIIGPHHSGEEDTIKDDCTRDKTDCILEAVQQGAQRPHDDRREETQLKTSRRVSALYPRLNVCNTCARKRNNIQVQIKALTQEAIHPTSNFSVRPRRYKRISQLTRRCDFKLAEACNGRSLAAASRPRPIKLQHRCRITLGLYLILLDIFKIIIQDYQTQTEFPVGLSHPGHHTRGTQHCVRPPRQGAGYRIKAPTRKTNQKTTKKRKARSSNMKTRKKYRLLRIRNETLTKKTANIDEERASMMREHAAALARETYEQLHECGMRNDEIRQEAQRLAVWDLQSQHLCGERYVGGMHKDGTIHYYDDENRIEYQDEHGMIHSVPGERIIRPNDPYVFRVRDEYHQLFIDRYYNGEDYASNCSEDASNDGEDTSMESEDSSNQ